MRPGNAQALAHGVPSLELHEQRQETTPLEHRHAVAMAEQRLGRPLSTIERGLDLVGLDRDLSNAKDQLEREIERAKKKAILRHLRDGGPVVVRTTPRMRSILRALYRAGQRHARAEIRAAGKTPFPTGTRLSSRDPDAVEARLAALLREYSQRLRRRVDAVPLEHGEVGVSIGDLASTSVGRAALDIPGARDVASRIVSTGLFSGVGDVYDSNAGLFDGWMYSAVMDAATCEVCSEADGTTYATWEEAMADLPDGGPNPDCDGEGRCRCRVVPA